MRRSADRRVRSRIRWALVLPIALSVLAAACGSDEPGSSASPGTDGGASSTTGSGEPTGEPIKVGVIEALSGPTAEIGEQERLGIEMAVDELNANGGVLGRPLEMVVRDDGAEPARSSAAARELVSQVGVAVIHGPTLSAPVLAAAPIATEASIPLFHGTTAADAGDAAQYPYTFRLAIPFSQYAKDFFDMADELGATRPAVLAVNDGFGTAFAENLQTEAGERGIDLAGVQFFESASLDLATPLRSLQNSGADLVIYAMSSIPDTIAALQARGLLGWDAPVLGSTSMPDPAIREAVGDDLMEGVYGHGVPNALVRDDSGAVEGDVQAWLDELRDRLGQDELTSGPALTLWTYSGVLMWAEAVEATGSLEGDDIKAYLEDNDFTLFGISYEFDDVRHDGQTQENNSWVVAASFDNGTYEAAAP